MNDIDFFTWYNSVATPDERKVAEKMGAFSELFSDMVFAQGTHTYPFLSCLTKPIDADDDCYEESTTDIPGEIEYFDVTTTCKIKVEHLEEGCGQYNIETKVITITPDHVDSDSTILHELIHVYEDMLESQMSFYRDIVFFSLYTDLKKCIPDLDTIIRDHANVLNQQSLNIIGGIHDILFLLKSFDLDIKQGYKLGTVFGYGMAEDLSNFHYHVEN